MPESLHVNGRDYLWPHDPTVVVCIDGCAPAYLEAAMAAHAMPFLREMIDRGTDLRAECVIPAFTNPNNLSILTGVPPAVHGICGNYVLDPSNGEAVMMNDPRFLRCGTIPAAFAAAGARVAVITAKDKLRALLGHGLIPAVGRAVCFSAECADAATVATHGIADVTDLLGRPVPSVYSAELSELVLAAGVTLLEQQAWDLMYLSTTDYIQHKHAPGTPTADAFYAMLDRHLARLDALGATIAITADHGMSAKHDAAGQPRVVYLQTLLDERMGPDRCRVILPITDPYVVHHGALGGFALVYLSDPADVEPARKHLSEDPGIREVLTRTEGCARFGLPLDRQGDLMVLAVDDTTLGTRAQDHDLSQLTEPLRSHGGPSEQGVPMLLNRRCDPARVPTPLRNFDAFHLALNATR
ncbi:Phosphonoacetate hydrolase [Thiocapsa sp. KS1]|nr:phosphonoacetate hydrolase [Thiocapsa sp. KS1]CRI66767.1 Phosphonoacetate hydrolase [Thiocapsa sp. KS1]